MVVLDEQGNFDVVSVPDAELSKVNTVYFVGENPTIEASPISFNSLEESATGGTESSEGKYYEYSFDGKTWSTSSDFGNQTPFTGTLTSDIRLYEYYTRKEISTVPMAWKWEVVDGASFVDGSVQKENRVISENASLTNNLVYEDETLHIIQSGDGREVTNLPTDLTRYGYRHVGWYSSPLSRVPRYGKTAIINLSVQDGYPQSSESTTTTLYAVWQKDTRFWTYDDVSKVDDFIPGTFVSENGDEDYPYYFEYGIPSTGYVFPEVYTVENDLLKVRKSDAFTYDFAIGENPITGYMLSRLNSWNERESMGYELPSNASVTSPTTQGYVGYGSKMTNRGVSSPLNDESHPLTFVSLAEGIIISNALTEYYNEHSRNSLTFAYKKQDGSAVKPLSEAVSLITSSSSTLADVTATGWRLPTNAEWDYASRVIGESAYPSEVVYSSDTYVGSSYPQFQNPEYVVGVNKNDKTKETVSLYSWYADNSQVTNGSESYYSTRGFNMSNASETPLAKFGSPIGIKGLSGNIAEWTDTKDDATSLNIVRGGSFTTSLENMYSGYIETLDASTKRYDIGVRLVRTI